MTTPRLGGICEMAIDTVSGYFPKMRLPLYSKITSQNQNDYKVGETYEIRVEDKERENGEKSAGSYNYTHESVLVAKQEVTEDSIHPILLAFDGHSKKKSEATDRILPGGEFRDDRDYVLLVFLRLDKAKEYVGSDMEFIPNDFDREDTEASL